MTARASRAAARAGRRAARRLNLIHRSNCSNPHGCLRSSRLSPAETVSFCLDSGCSAAVVEAAFLIAVKLHEGGYAKST